MAGDATIGLEDLKAKVTELYKFRDHFFEENNLLNKSQHGFRNGWTWTWIWIWFCQFL